jgi:hypothetical protein
VIESTTPPRRSKTSFMWTKKLVYPLVLACLGKWFDHRLNVEKIRADAGYAAVAPAFKEMQTAITMLSSEVALLKQLVLVQQQQERSAHPVATPNTNVALDTFSDKLVVKVQKSQGAHMIQRQLPANLDDAIQTKK